MVINKEALVENYNSQVTNLTKDVFVSILKC